MPHPDPGGCWAKHWGPPTMQKEEPVPPARQSPAVPVASRLFKPWAPPRAGGETDFSHSFLPCAQPLVTYWQGGKEIWSIRQRCWGGGIWPAVEIAQSPTLKLPSSVEEERKQASGDAIPRQVEQGMKEPRGLASANGWLWSQQRKKGGANPSPPLPLFPQCSFCFLGFHLCVFEGNMVAGMGQMERMRWGWRMGVEGNSTWGELVPSRPKSQWIKKGK